MAESSKRASRSPNYPLKSIEWALEKALELLDKEGLHSVPADIVAQNLGYKDANNGNARRALAILKAFGMLDKAPNGKLAVSQEVRRYKLLPEESEKIVLLKQWLNKPLLYKKLLDKYDTPLPSNRVLLFELVDEHGFNESAAEKAIKVFLQSVEFVNNAGLSANECEDNAPIEDDFEDVDVDADLDVIEINQEKEPQNSESPKNLTQAQAPQKDRVRYPVRLTGGRMAWIDVPEPFYEADKIKLVAQIEIIGTDDEDNEFGDLEM